MHTTVDQQIQRHLTMEGAMVVQTEMPPNNAVKPRLAGAWTCRKRHAIYFELQGLPPESQASIQII
jgi:hypothetical protein